MASIQELSPAAVPSTVTRVQHATALEGEDGVFGDAMRAAHFPHHPPRDLRLNNGSFGACPTPVMDVCSRFRSEWQVAPDRFWLTRLAPCMEAAREAVAVQVARCLPEEVILVSNLTVASTMVANWLEEDVRHAATLAGAPTEFVTLVCNLTYGSVSKAMQRTADRLRATGGPALVLETVDVPFPLRDTADLIAVFEARLTAIKAKYPPAALRLATIDHISSVPAIVMPVHTLVSMLRAAGGFRRVFVDGAHGPGTIPSLDVPAIGADFYAGNIHKWMFAPTAAAFIYRRRPIVDGVPAEAEVLHHPITSHNYGAPEDEISPEDGFSGGWGAEARMLGTFDYSAMLSVPAAVTFYMEAGGDDVARRNRALALRASRMLAEAWGTELGTPEECVGSCCMVGLPAALGSTMEEGKALRMCLATTATADYDGITTQYFFPAAGRLWLRLSAAVYNSLREFEVLRDVILDLAAAATAAIAAKST